MVRRQATPRGWCRTNWMLYATGFVDRVARRLPKPSGSHASRTLEDSRAGLPQYQQLLGPAPALHGPEAAGDMRVRKSCQVLHDCRCSFAQSTCYDFACLGM